MLIGSDNARAMSPDLEALLGPAACAIQAGAGKIPFICFDLAGGANLTGSEMLCGVERQSAELPVHAGLRHARPAGQHDAGFGQCGQPD